MLRQQLTQGQPLAEMTLAVQRQEEKVSVPSEQPILFAQPASIPSTQEVDVHAIAKRVYELMRQDLRLERERRGWRPKEGRF